MRHRIQVGVALGVAALLFAGCTSGDPAATPTSASPAVSSPSSGQRDEVSPGTATPSGRSLPETWAGTWTSAGETRQASLRVTSKTPLRASIEVVGRCMADWLEESRDGDEIIVRATVTSGPCADNRWRITAGEHRLRGVDVADAATTVDFPGVWTPYPPP